MPGGVDWIQILSSGGAVGLTLGLVYSFWRWVIKPQKELDDRRYDELLDQSQARDEAYRTLLQAQGSQLSAIAETNRASSVALSAIAKQLEVLNERINTHSRHG